MDTLRLALLLLWAYASAHGGQSAALLNHLSGTYYIAYLQLLDKSRDIDIHRTALHAGRILAIQAAMRFGDGLLHGQTLIHLFV